MRIRCNACLSSEILFLEMFYYEVFAKQKKVKTAQTILLFQRTHVRVKESRCAWFSSTNYY
jgi:hypothetical protein